MLDSNQHLHTESMMSYVQNYYADRYDSGLINNYLYPLDEYTIVPGITPGSEAHFSTGLPSSAKFADKLSKIYRSA